jgi:hypothetical protein
MKSLTTLIVELTTRDARVEEVIRILVRFGFSAVARRNSLFASAVNADLSSRLEARIRATDPAIPALVSIMEHGPERHRLRFTEDLATVARVAFKSVVYVAYDTAVSGLPPAEIERVLGATSTMLILYLVRDPVL